MQYLHAHNPKKSSLERGFTLVEMLIVVPIAVLVVGALVSAMVAMISDTIVTNATSSITYNSQDSLNRIEQDIRVSINFMGTLTNLSSPQGRDGATAPFLSSSGDLILTQQATTSSPYEATRELVYYKNQPNACGSASITSNRTLLSRAVYFLKTNGDGTKTLWRRTIVNPANLSSADSNTICGTPYQRNSCSVGTTPTATVGSTCQTFDEKLVDNVSAFTTTYYTAAGTTTTDPTQAVTVQVSLSISQTVAGKTIAKTVNVRGTRVNDVAAPSPPLAPAISIFNPSSTEYNNSILTSFQWSSAFATSYAVQTKIGAGSWSSPTYTIGTTQSISTQYAGTTVTIRVIAYNDYGQTAQSEMPFTPDIWTPCTLQNNWTSYGGSYGPAEFTRTDAGIVEVRGLIKDGVNGYVCTLPVGMRPSARLIFPGVSNRPASYGGMTRLDVQTDGQIWSYNADPGWLSLNGIDFVSSDTSYTWTNLSLVGGATDDPGYGKVSYTSDSAGRTQLQGSVRPGSLTDGAIFAQTLPAALRPSEYYHLPAGTNDTYNNFGLNGPAGTLVSKGNPSSFASIQQMIYPSSYNSSWTAMTFSNNWTNYNTSAYPAASSRRGSDGICSLKGLIRRTTGNGTAGLLETIGTLPSNCHPRKEITFIIASWATPGIAGSARINIDSFGNVKFVNSSETWTSLDGLRFFADGS